MIRSWLGGQDRARKAKPEKLGVQSGPQGLSVICDLHSATHYSSTKVVGNNKGSLEVIGGVR